MGRWTYFNKGGTVAPTYPKKMFEKTYDVDHDNVGMGFSLPVYYRDLMFYEDGFIALRNEGAVKEQIVGYAKGLEDTLDYNVFSYLLSNPLNPFTGDTAGLRLVSATHLTAPAAATTFSNRITVGFGSGLQDALLEGFKVVDKFVDGNNIPIVNNRSYFNTLVLGNKWYDKVLAILQTQSGASAVAGEEMIKNPLYGKFPTVLNVPYMQEGTAYEDWFFIIADPKPTISSFELMGWENDYFDVEEIPGQSQEKYYNFKGVCFREIGCRDAQWIAGYIG
jgi:hypothetical protein